MKSTKNNTCLLCGNHIDKSDAQNSWTTIIRTKYYIDNEKSEKGYDEVKGKRITLCWECASDVHNLITDKQLEQLKEKEEAQK